MLPITSAEPPFALTRASHVRLQVTDLAASRDFYRDAIGLVVTEETADAVYLRGWEESTHHSLVLERGPEAKALQIGFRVRTDRDITAAGEYFAGTGIPYHSVEVPHQGRTVRFVNPVGTHVELTSAMSVVERRHQNFADSVAATRRPARDMALVLRGREFVTEPVQQPLLSTSPRTLEDALSMH